MSTSLPKLAGLILLFPGLILAQEDSARYFYHGDGQLAVKGGEQKLKHLTPRLVALLDYLQDQLTGGKGPIEIYSGYRSPKYNEQLRRRGQLAGKASLHMDGMAADFIFPGVDPKRIWELVRTLDCCGAGYYQGQMVHVDCGPKRFWDQTTTKVFTDISEHNKQIYLVTDYDIYQPEATITFRFVRITEYPFGVEREWGIVGKNKTLKKLKLSNQEECQMIRTRKDAQNWTLPLPKGLPKNKKLYLKAYFCNKSPNMPDFVLSNPFVIK